MEVTSAALQAAVPSTAEKSIGALAFRRVPGIRTQYHARLRREDTDHARCPLRCTSYTSSAKLRKTLLSAHANQQVTDLPVARVRFGRVSEYACSKARAIACEAAGHRYRKPASVAKPSPTPRA